MGGATRLLVNCRSMEVSNLLYFLKSGVADCRILSISGLMLRTQGGAVVTIIKIRDGDEVSLIPQEWPILPGMVPSTPILIIFRGVLLVHALPGVASTNIFFTASVISICAASITGFVGGVKAEIYPMVRQLNNVSSSILLLVWVTASELFVRLPCASLAVALFNSYPASFIVKLFIASTRLSNFSSLSLVKTVFKFSLYELDAWLKASAVRLLSSIIDSYSASIMNFSIASWIFTLDNGVSLFSLKVVMVLISSI